MKILGIIPARGGSKGIPRKNIVDLCGKPLLAWTAETALAANLDRVILSTDDEEIADVGRSLGLEVPFMRPASLSGDDTPTVKVLRHVLKTIDGEWDGLLILQPTNPCRTVEDIAEAVRIFERFNGRDAVVSMSAVREHPWEMGIVHNGRIQWQMSNQGRFMPRQCRPPMCVRDGGIYLIPTVWTRANKWLLPDVCHPLIIPPERSIRIDTPEDLERAAAHLTKTGRCAKSKAERRRSRRQSPKRKRPAAPQSSS